MSEYKIGQEVWAFKLDNLKPKVVRGILIGISEKAIFNRNGEIVTEATHYTIKVKAWSANCDRLDHESGFTCLGTNATDLINFGVRPYLNDLFRLAEKEILSLEKGDQV